jgi:hypothetical protein
MMRLVLVGVIAAVPVAVMLIVLQPADAVTPDTLPPAVYHTQPTTP